LAEDNYWRDRDEQEAPEDSVEDWAEHEDYMTQLGGTPVCRGTHFEKG